MTRILLSQSGGYLYVEHGGKTNIINASGAAYPRGNGSVDAGLVLGGTTIFDNTTPKPAPEPEPMPRPEVGEHVWIEYLYGGYTEHVSTGTVLKWVKDGKQEYVVLDNDDHGYWWPGTVPENKGHTVVVAWGLVEPERKVKWPKGATVQRTFVPDEFKTLTEDVYEDQRYFSGSRTDDPRDYVRNYQRVEIKVVG